MCSDVRRYSDKIKSILQKIELIQRDEERAERAIKEYVSGEDAFVCLPTG